MFYILSSWKLNYDFGIYIYIIYSHPFFFDFAWNLLGTLLVWTQHKWWENVPHHDHQSDCISWNVSAGSRLNHSMRYKITISTLSEPVDTIYVYIHTCDITILNICVWIFWSVCTYVLFIITNSVNWSSENKLCVILSILLMSPPYSNNFLQYFGVVDWARPFGLNICYEAGGVTDHLRWITVRSWVLNSNLIWGKLCHKYLHINAGKAFSIDTICLVWATGRFEGDRRAVYCNDIGKWCITISSVINSDRNAFSFSIANKRSPILQILFLNS